MSSQTVWRCRHCGNTMIMSGSGMPGYCRNCDSSFSFVKESGGDDGIGFTGGSFFGKIFENIVGLIIGAILGIIIVLLREAVSVLWRGLKSLANYLCTKIRSSTKENDKVNS